MLSRVDALDHYFPNDAQRILDVGCYTGVYSARISHYRVPELCVVGIDRDLKALRRAKHNLYSVIYCDACSLPFRAHVFDHAVVSEVIEHLPKEDGFRLIEELKHCCRNAVVTTPNIAGPGDEELTVEHPLMLHQSVYTPRDLHALGATEVRGVFTKHTGNKLIQRVTFLLSYYFPSLGSILVAYFNFEQSSD